MVLDPGECMELLAAKSVGRIAYASDAGARILPVNYVLVDDSCHLRTVPDGEIFHHAPAPSVPSRSTRPTNFSGPVGAWSSLGAQLATEDDFAHMLYGKVAEPWAGGNRYMFVRAAASKCPDEE